HPGLCGSSAECRLGSGRVGSAMGPDGAGVAVPSQSRQLLAHRSAEQPGNRGGGPCARAPMGGVGGGKRRLIPALVHGYDRLTLEERSSLRGLLSFARSIEPDLLNRLVLKYGALKMTQVLK